MSSEISENTFEPPAPKKRKLPENAGKLIHLLKLTNNTLIRRDFTFLRMSGPTLLPSRAIHHAAWSSIREKNSGGGARQWCALGWFTWGQHFISHYFSRYDLGICLHSSKAFVLGRTLYCFSFSYISIDNFTALQGRALHWRVRSNKKTLKFVILWTVRRSSKGVHRGFDALLCRILGN